MHNKQLQPLKTEKAEHNQANMEHLHPNPCQLHANTKEPNHHHLLHQIQYYLQQIHQEANHTTVQVEVPPNTTQALPNQMPVAEYGRIPRKTEHLHLHQIPNQLIVTDATNPKKQLTDQFHQIGLMMNKPAAEMTTPTSTTLHQLRKTTEPNTTFKFQDPPNPRLTECTTISAVCWVAFAGT